jgi:Tol biopolymer transport system component
MSSRRINEVSFTSVGFVDPSGRILYSDLPDPPGAAGFANGMLAWSRDGRRVAVVRQQAGSPASIWLLDPASPTPYTQLIEFPPGPRIRGLTWTSDGQALIVGRHDWTSDIVLMDQSR